MGAFAFHFYSRTAHTGKFLKETNVLNEQARSDPLIAESLVSVFLYFANDDEAHPSVATSCFGV